MQDQTYRIFGTGGYKLSNHYMGLTYYFLMLYLQLVKIFRRG